MKRGLVMLAWLWVMLSPLTASAIPAFSRQIHADCRTCHFQGMGALNRFGRAFQMNNFSLSEKMRRQLREQQQKQREKRKHESRDKGR